MVTEPVPDMKVYDEAQRLIAECGVKVTYSGTKPAYYPKRDEVVIPPFSWFESEEEFCGVTFHELAHATGHEGRLKRNLSTRFGSESYAFEELVAELSSAFLCAHSGIPARHRSASYLDSWLKVFKEDKRAIFNAASYASQAADWVRNAAAPEPEPEETSIERSQREMADAITY